ncbi:MAG TPA: S8 family serine peptidase, partial [Saprospiraceae bacterium]|nr:S8 family serine peptidase [Saprospiraceae bacterium]
MKNYLVYLCLLLFLNAVCGQSSRPPVRFEQGPVWFPDNLGQAAPAPDPAEIVNGRYVRFCQSETILLTEQRRRLETEGVGFIGYVDFGGYLISLPAGFDPERLQDAGIRSMTAVQTDWKMSRALQQPPYPAWARHPEGLIVQIQIYPHLSIPEGADACRKNGLTVLEEGNQNGWLLARIPFNRIQETAALPFVQYIDLAPAPPIPDDTRGRSLHRSNLLDRAGSDGLQYDGSGVTVLVRDDGLVGPHIDFQGRLQNLTPDDGADHHADGVTGILAGAGNRDPSKQGMASGANIKVIAYTAGFQDATLSLHLNENVTITNSSYSEGCNEGYNLNAQTVDQQITQHPTLMHVFSAGNRGTDNCGYGAGPVWGTITGGHKIAKNVIATANLRPDGSLDPTSSRGPAADGRLKPDIAANGTEQNSTAPNHAYIIFGGTSGASPGIAGCLAQLTQAWKTLTNQAPKTAMLKAALLNTATDLGNPGPDYEYGFGQVNAWRAWNLLQQSRYYNYEIDQGQPGTTVVMNIPPGTREARFMLLWPDPPAQPFAAKSLINDLDLRVKQVSNQAEYLPLVLNPSPDPNVLNTPASPGRDSLNNVEQIVLYDPQPGTYLATISGYAIPEGPQNFWLVWEYLSDSVQITYPAGGESLVPGEVERIHWDAYGIEPGADFTLEFYNGQNWTTIATPAYWQRFYDWAVPQNTVTPKARLRITRNGISHETGPFNIVRVPSGLSVARVCPDSMTVSWTPLQDTLSYKVYLLGQKYMEVIGASPTPSCTFPISNPLTEKWVSVSAFDDDGLTGRRAIALRWPGELKDCQQAYDLGVRTLTEPSPGGVFTCGPVQQNFSVMVRNEGLEAISGAQLFLKINNQPAVSEPLPDLAPGDAHIHTFQQSIILNTNDSLELRFWASFPADQFKWNDTLRFKIPVFTQPASTYFTEPFSTPDFPNPGWSVINPDGSMTWQRSTGVTGIQGNFTRAVWIDCFDYGSIGQQDGLQMLPVDLTNIVAPGLVFDLAHARLTNHVEQLRVEVYPACDPNAQAVVIWEKADPDLGTTNPVTGFFTPNEAADWRTEVADLAQFAGQKILIRFVATNDYGNNIFLDNIGIQPFNLSAPEAVFALPDSICRGDTLNFIAQPGGNYAEYNWSFGSGAIPVLAFGQGPHQVIYPTPGLKQVRLVVTNPAGSDTTKQLMTVLGFPTADFSYAANGPDFTFSNLSQNATAYVWDFGDGAVSTEVSPTHTFPGGGAYKVTLQASNACKTAVDSTTVVATVGTSDRPTEASMQVSPNPTGG